MTEGVIKVFLLDDHEVVRRGIIGMLQRDPKISIVGEAATVGEARTRIPASSPDVALLDARLPDGSGIELCAELQKTVPAARVLILTSHEDDEALFEAVMAGAAGYLLKTVRGTNLVEAIHQVASGQSLLDPAVTGKLMQRLREAQRPDPVLAQLGERDRELLDLIAEGLSNRQIAERLFLAEKTVKNRVSMLLDKLGMQSRTQVAVFGASLKRP